MGLGLGLALSLSLTLALTCPSAHRIVRVRRPLTTVPYSSVSSCVSCTYSSSAVSAFWVAVRIRLARFLLPPSLGPGLNDSCGLCGVRGRLAGLPG